MENHHAIKEHVIKKSHHRRTCKMEEDRFAKDKTGCHLKIIKEALNETRGILDQYNEQHRKWSYFEYTFNKVRRLSDQISFVQKCRHFAICL